MEDKERDEDQKSDNPPFVVPPKPSSFAEMLAFHKANGTLREFLGDLNRDR